MLQEALAISTQVHGRQSQETAEILSDLVTYGRSV